MKTNSFRAKLNLVLASPRGFCAGVDRAITIVEKALEIYGSPIYVQHEEQPQQRAPAVLDAEAVPPELGAVEAVLLDLCAVIGSPGLRKPSVELWLQFVLAARRTLGYE